MNCNNLSVAGKLGVWVYMYVNVWPNALLRAYLKGYKLLGITIVLLITSLA